MWPPIPANKTWEIVLPTWSKFPALPAVVDFQRRAFNPQRTLRLRAKSPDFCPLSEPQGIDISPKFSAFNVPGAAQGCQGFEDYGHVGELDVSFLRGLRVTA